MRIAINDLKVTIMRYCFSSLRVRNPEINLICLFSQQYKVLCKIIFFRKIFFYYLYRQFIRILLSKFQIKGYLASNIFSIDSRGTLFELNV